MKTKELLPLLRMVLGLILVIMGIRYIFLDDYVRACIGIGFGSFFMALELIRYKAGKEKK